MPTTMGNGDWIRAAKCQVEAVQSKCKIEWWNASSHTTLRAARRVLRANYPPEYRRLASTTLLAMMGRTETYHPASPATETLGAKRAVMAADLEASDPRFIRIGEKPPGSTAFAVAMKVAAEFASLIELHAMQRRTGARKN